MKCRKCIYLRGLSCVILGKTVHSGLGPKCKYYTETVLDRAGMARKGRECTRSTGKKTER